MPGWVNTCVCTTSVSSSVCIWAGHLYFWRWSTLTLFSHIVHCHSSRLTPYTAEDTYLWHASFSWITQPFYNNSARKWHVCRKSWWIIGHAASQSYEMQRSYDQSVQKRNMTVQKYLKGNSLSVMCQIQHCEEYGSKSVRWYDLKCQRC